jgi:hypothetical protein
MMKKCKMHLILYRMEDARFKTQTIFGMRLDGKFPRKRAPCNPGCGCGIFDASRGSDGIDLILESSNEVSVNSWFILR